MVVIPITKEIQLEANDMLKNTKVLRNSITKGGGNLAGCIGEIGVRNYLNDKHNSGAEIIGDYQYDIITRKGIKLEVKTKRCTSVPKPYYECSVANFNTRQKCDYYVFTRVSSDSIYLLGWLSKEDFHQKSRQMEKGDKDSNIVGGKSFEFHADCKNVFISDLVPFK